MAKFEFGFEEPWFRLIIKELPKHPDLFDPKQVENAQIILRVGKLKVGAAKLWAETARIISKKKKFYAFTPLGSIISKFDPSMDEDGLWWIIHYNLACIGSAAWFYSFYINYFDYDSFDRSTFEAEVSAYWRRDHTTELTEKTFDKLIFSPFKQVFDGTKLGRDFRLFNQDGSGFFQRAPAGFKNIHPAIVGYALCDWARSNKRHTAHIEELMFPGAPGKILRLDRSSLDDLLVQLGERYMKKVAWISHTASLNSVAIQDIAPEVMLLTYYLEFEERDPVIALQSAIERLRSGEFGDGK